jgi:hypothetical protein
VDWRKRPGGREDTDVTLLRGTCVMLEEEKLSK